MNEKSELINPQKAYFNGKFKEKLQKVPGVQAEMEQKPDCGEDSYQGCNRLAGRKALVTGGDSGIGRAAAIAFAREGADVALNYFPSEEEDAEEVKKLIEKAGQKAVLLPGDLNRREVCAEIVEKAVDGLGGLDVWVWAAGRQTACPDLAELSDAQLLETFQVNVFSMFWTVKAALPHLPTGSSIITTSSIQAYQPSKYLLDYAATKGAIVCFTRALAKQLADRGIRANSVAPGPIWTPLQICGGQLPENIPEFGQETPLRRAGQPAELASLYVYLASNESSYVTAEVMGVTGGMHLS